MCVVAVWNKRNVSYAVGYEGECVKRGSWIRTKLTKVSASTAWSLLMTVCVLVYVCVHEPVRKCVCVCVCVCV